MPKLTQIQNNTADKIIKIGRDMGKNDTQIMTALKVAFIESSLGENKGKNPDSTAQGLYQYLDGSWKSHQGDRNNDEDSIRAFYKDMQNYDNRYSQHQADAQKEPETYKKQPTNQQIPADVTRDEYIYTKHHDGPNASGDSFNRDGNMDKGINIYDARSQGQNGADEAAAQALKKGKTENIPETPSPSQPSVSQSLPASTTQPSPAQKPLATDDDKDSNQKQQASILDYFKKGANEVEEVFSNIWRR